MLYIASDHGGFELKEELKKYLKKNNIEYKDLGPDNLDNADDYPDFALKVAKKVAKNIDNKGILVCGTGIGMCMTANKVKGIRAALCYDERTAKLSREHNDSNILAMGARVIGLELAKEIVDLWLSTEYEGGRHNERNDHIMELDSKYRKLP